MDFATRRPERDRRRDRRGDRARGRLPAGRAPAAPRARRRRSPSCSKQPLTRRRSGRRAPPRACGARAGPDDVERDGSTPCARANASGRPGQRRAAPAGRRPGAGAGRARASTGPETRPRAGRPRRRARPASPSGPPVEEEVRRVRRPRASASLQPGRQRGGRDEHAARRPPAAGARVERHAARPPRSPRRPTAARARAARASARSARAARLAPGRLAAPRASAARRSGRAAARRG